jgi:cellulose synthase/poly-beta-1,6-N-acetylglucosamine synthase-like glycosyltransferase
MSIESAVFWGALLLLAYTHFGYPVLIAAWARRARPSVDRGDALPAVSILVVAHDEAHLIEARIRNLLALDYPREKLDVMIASDGSTDGTAERARAYEAESLRVFAFNARRGKAAVLNELVPQARAAIVTLADARQQFEPGALRALVAPFQDERVGAVSGELMLQSGNDRRLGQGVGLYWRYEKWIRGNEARADSTVGTTGAIYAIRRDLFEPIPPDTILDDVLVPMRIVRQGYRALFEPRARAHDRISARPEDEFQRKVRTIAGNFQLFARERWLLDPRRNRIWFQTASHKALRLLTPFLLAAILLGSLALHEAWIARAALAGQAAFYGAALTGHALRDGRRRSPLLTVPYVTCLLAIATLVALARCTFGGQAVTWQKCGGSAGVAPAIPPS